MMNVVLNQAVMGKVEQLATVKRFQQPLPKGFWRPITKDLESQIRRILRIITPEELANKFPWMTTARKWKFRLWKTPEVNRMRRATSCLEILGMFHPPLSNKLPLNIVATPTTVTTSVSLRWKSTRPNEESNEHADLNNCLCAFRNESNPRFTPHGWTLSGRSGGRDKTVDSLPNLIGSRSRLSLPTEAKPHFRPHATLRDLRFNRDQQWVYTIEFRWRKGRLVRPQVEHPPRLPVAILSRQYHARRINPR